MTRDTERMSKRITADPEVVVTELDDGEGVLLHLGTRKYFSLNKTGFEIWQLLNEGLTLGEVSERLESTYSIPLDRADAAVSNLLSGLLEAGLARVED